MAGESQMLRRYVLYVLHLAQYALPVLPLALFLLAACTSPASPAGLSISVPTAVQAGDPIQVDVTAADDDGAVFLLAMGTFGSVPLMGTLAGGTAHLYLDSIYSRHAGVVTFLARSQHYQAQATTTIRPNQPADPILPLVGPRSIVADGEHWTMLVAVPTDSHGNPLADGYPVTVRAQHPLPDNGDPLAAVEVQVTKIEHLFAWARIYSRTNAGRTFLSIGAGDANSPERDVLEVPGKPVPFRLYTEQSIAVADGRQWVQINSEQIRDRFGNLLLDGTSVQLLAESSDGSRRFIPTLTQDGRIYASLQSPSAPGTLTVQAQIADVLSNPLTLRFTPGPAVNSFPVQTEMTAGYLLLTAGPLLGPINQFIPDGTVVRFTLTGPTGTPIEAEAPSEFGYALLRLRREGLIPGSYWVEAAVGTGQGRNSFVVP